MMICLVQEMCELDMKETEILFFLLVIIMIRYHPSVLLGPHPLLCRSRKTGSTGVIAYLTNGFIYAKGANIILYFVADPRLGLVYVILVLLQVITSLAHFKIEPVKLRSDRH